MARPTNTEKHRAVLDAATVVIRERGLHAASMSAIADAANMSKSTLFNYFESKAELIERLQERLFEIARDELASVADATDLSPVERLRQLLHIHAHHCVQRLSSPVLVAFIQRWGPPNSEHGQQQITARRRYEVVFERALAECVAGGEFNEVDVRVATLGLIGTTTWIAMWYVEGEDRPLPVIVDDLLDMCFVGLRSTSEA